jgi:chemotaxis protein methyltransferase CheR
VFARIARPQDGERLILLLKDPSASVRRLAVAGLARLDSDAALESVRLAVADESVRVRVAAAAALGASRRLQAVEDLERLALDEDLRVRSAALRAIGRHRACSREAAPEDVVAPSALGARSVVGLSDTEFRTYCDLLRGYCGLHFDESSRFLLEKRVARRIRELDLESFAAYQYKLQSAEGDDEMAHLADVLTTNETYFFRERSQLAALVEEVVPELLRCSRRPIRIWSAGCSSGEEPYSVVALAREAGLDPGRDICVYASDISRQMLRRCRRGVYREASFRETSDELRARYFSEKDGLHQICDEIKRHVDFIHLNLLAESKLSLLGTMDVVLCRNVIIYFDAETKRRVIQSFYDRLRPGGYLLLGHSESLINVSSAFELARLERDLVYRRPVPGEKALDPWHQIAGATSATLVDVDGSER